MSASTHLLAIDCATLPASVAVVCSDGATHEIVHRDEQRADAWVGPAVQRCLQQGGVRMQDIDGFAACVGPGTFTGIRVGIATALGYAAPRGLPVCGVRSVDALALLGADRNADVIAACIDARRNQVYAAIYKRESVAARAPLQPLWGPSVCDPGEVSQRIAEHETQPLIIGSGAGLLAERAPDPVAERAPDPETPLAAALGRLALRSWPAGSALPQDWPPAEPLYLRPPDARPPRNPLREARRARAFERS